MTGDQRGALLATLREWESWLEAREATAPPGFIIYRPSGTARVDQTVYDHVSAWAPVQT